MDNRKQLYKRLFFDTIWTSSVAFGGGMVVLGMIRSLYVEKYGYLSDDELTDMIALAQSAPGAISANTFMMLGYNLAGFWGSVITMLANIIPPLVIITVLSYFYNYIRDNTIAEYILKAMRAGVVAVIMSVCVDMILNATKKGKNITAIVILMVAFIFSYLIKFPAIYIIISAAVIGVAIYFVKLSIMKRNGGAEK